jgi:uncharacterized protein
VRSCTSTWDWPEAGGAAAVGHTPKRAGRSLKSPPLGNTHMNEVMIPPVSVFNPCINICRMDLDGKYCQGCGRSSVEIGLWEKMTEAERGEVMASLVARQPWRSRKPLPPFAA